MKAWHVQDKQGERQEIIFAEKRSEAILQSEAYSWDGEYINVRAKRAKYADGLEKESKDRQLEVLLNYGWWFECGKCYKRVTEDDDYLIKNGWVYCKECSA